MDYDEAARRLADCHARIAAVRAEMRAIQDSVEPRAVEDYRLVTSAGPVRLSALFGDRSDLFVVHNMGAACPYCTLWADGFNGVYHHLATRAAFVVCSPDPPAVQQRFAASRGWRFPMASHAGSGFAADMGYRSADGGWLPGLSVFRRDGDRIVRVSDRGMAPGDPFCAVWHLLDLLPGGADGWQPRLRYG